MASKRIPKDKKVKSDSGKTFGRFPTYTDEHIDQLAEELVEWVQDESNYILLDFCNKRFILAERLSEWAQINEKFRQALNIAKQTIAKRREDMVNSEQLNYGVYQRYQGMYDPTLTKHERAEKAYEAELKRQIISNTGANISINLTDYGKS